MSNSVWSDEVAWAKAKEQIKTALRITAQVHGKVISYTDLSARVTAVPLDAHSPLLPHILGEVSTEENVAGRGMLTVLVVRRGETMPVKGFFELARKLGRTGSDMDIWIAELKKVHDANKVMK